MSQLCVLLPSEQYLSEKSIHPEKMKNRGFWWMRPHGLLDLELFFELLKKDKYTLEMAMNGQTRAGGEGRAIMFTSRIIHS